MNYTENEGSGDLLATTHAGWARLDVEAWFGLYDPGLVIGRVLVPTSSCGGVSDAVRRRAGVIAVLNILGEEWSDSS